MRWVQQWTATAPSPTHLDRNEDNLWVARSGRAAAVIDGMGGYRRQTAQGAVGGEHASALAAQVLAEQLDEWDGTLTLQAAKLPLRAAIEAANQRIWDELNWAGRIPAEENPQGKALDELTVGVALTVVALCDGGSRAVLAQHGDTHGYALKPEMGLVQLTEDQDLLLWEHQQGLVTADEMARIGQVIDHFDGLTMTEAMDTTVMRYFFDKNIFGALGVGGECPVTSWSAIRLAPGDRLVLLSDGAYANASLPELAALVALSDDPARLVVELAQQRGLLPRFPDPNDLSKPYNMRATQDDMTAVVVVVGEEEERGERGEESDGMEDAPLPPGEAGEEESGEREAESDGVDGGMLPPGDAPVTDDAPEAVAEADPALTEPITQREPSETA